jgi:hypothetical protein
VFEKGKPAGTGVGAVCMAWPVMARENKLAKQQTNRPINRQPTNQPTIDQSTNQPTTDPADGQPTEQKRKWFVKCMVLFPDNKIKDTDT